MNPRHLVALALLVLTGCANYQWFQTGLQSDWYRWEIVPKQGFKERCGFMAPSAWNGGGACVVRLQQGVVMPGDKNLHSGEVAKDRSIGKLCVVIATMSEEEAKRMADWEGSRSLWEHEVIEHCAAGLNHTGGPT
jgi:hypothetical protein